MCLWQNNSITLKKYIEWECFLQSLTCWDCGGDNVSHIMGKINFNWVLFEGIDFQSEGLDDQMTLNDQYNKFIFCLIYIK